jgi:hypothetical protein
MATEDLNSTGIFIARRQPQTESASVPASVTTPVPVELVGHVAFVERNVPTNFNGMRALLKLRDPPGGTVVVVATQLRLQTLLVSALNSGNLIACLGERIAAPPVPQGRTQAVDVYAVDGVILYSSP